MARILNFGTKSWVGDCSLRSKFNKLYYLSTKKEAKVGEVCSWVNGKWHWDLRWRRILRHNEDQWVME